MHPRCVLMVMLYGAAMTLLIAQTFGLPGYTVWAVLWCGLTFRAVRGRA